MKQFKKLICDLGRCARRLFTAFPVRIAERTTSRTSPCVRYADVAIGSQHKLRSVVYRRRLVEVDRRRQVSVSSKNCKATDSENNGTKSHLISFWSEMRNVGVLSSTDEDFIEALKVWAKANGYRVEQS